MYDAGAYIHEGVNLSLVWEIIAEDLSTLQTQLMMLLGK